MATRSEQLEACADWNVAESERAFKEWAQEKDTAKRAYLLRRHHRLSAQAADLYEQSRNPANHEQRAA